MFINSKPKTKICPTCGNTILASEGKCPNCDHNFGFSEPKPVPKVSVWQRLNDFHMDKIFAFGILAGFIISKLFHFISDGQSARWEHIFENDKYNYYVDTATYSCHCFAPAEVGVSLKEVPKEEGHGYTVMRYTAHFDTSSLITTETKYNSKGQKLGTAVVPTIPLEFATKNLTGQAIDKALTYCRPKCK